MAREHSTRLREDPGAAPPGAPTIDADFAVVKGPRRRSVVGWIKWWSGAIALACLIGMMIPPAVLIAQAFLAARG